MRAAVGEYTAMVFLPLVVCGVALLYRVDRPTWKAGVPLAVGMAGLAMCHLLSLEMTGLFLVLFVLAAAKRTFCKARIVALIRAALLAAGLSAWFLVPMLHSMVTQNIQATNVYPYNFQQRGVDLMDLFAPVPLNYAQQNGVRGELGLGLIVALVVCLGVVWQRGPLKQVRGRRMHILQYTLGFGVLAMVLSLRIFPWNILFSHFPSTVLHKFLGMVQFPWRYLGLASVLLCVSVAIALQLLRDWGYAGTQKVAAALLLGTVVYTAAFYGGLEQMQPTTSNIYGAANVDSLQIGGGKDYVLPGEVDYNYAYPTQLSDSLVIQRYEKNDGVACITLENTADTEGSVVLPINDYGNYTATDDQGNILPLSTSENSLLVLTVPGGYSGMVSVSYREPLLWRVAELLSLVTAVVLCIAGIRSRKVKRPLQQLSCDLPGQTR